LNARKAIETAWIAILQNLTAHAPNQPIVLAALSQNFYEQYQQPIRAVMHNVCPGMKLVVLLSTLPGWQIQKVGNDWQITMEIHLAK
jgi:hypothetical protein